MRGHTRYQFIHYKFLVSYIMNVFIEHSSLFNGRLTASVTTMFLYTFTLVELLSSSLIRPARNLGVYP